MYKYLISLVVISFISVNVENAAVIHAKGNNRNFFDSNVCDSLPEFNDRIKSQIRDTSKDVQRIIDYVVNGPDKGKTYDQLSIFVDKFGPRFAGTKTFEDSIDYVLNKMKIDGHDNVHTENAPLIPWTRGKEWAKMLTPRLKDMAILGLGGSVGTGKNRTIKAQVMVVKTFDELYKRGSEAKGKMVVYNFDYHSYPEQVEYRGKGASEAAKYGAVAALIRSVTPLSIYSPHTGGQIYENNVTLIPAVSITVEDAELIHRLIKRGENVSVELYMEAENGKQVITRNTISESIGTQFPEQVVLISGHLDSWDVGQGAMDDGGGAFISWRALSILKKLGLKPRRTIRSVLWAAEEYGYIGAQQYLTDHMKELNNISVAMESDGGTFTPTGLSYSGNNTVAQCIVYETLQLLKSINASQLLVGIDGSDVELFMDKGVPISALENQNDKYFYFHHSNGDTMSVEDPHVLDLCLAVWTSTSYVFAMIDNLLPR